MFLVDARDAAPPAHPRIEDAVLVGQIDVVLKQIGAAQEWQYRLDLRIVRDLDDALADSTNVRFQDQWKTVLCSKLPDARGLVRVGSLGFEQFGGGKA